MSFARPMIAGTLARYFGLRFLYATVLTFGGIFVLIALIDYIELMRHSADRNVSAWLVARTSFYRVPQLAERVLPFTVLIAAMASFLALSRRLELVVARAAGVSAWQFIAPALLLAAFIGALTTMLYNPIAAALQERSKRLEQQISGNFVQSGLQATQSGFWLRQRSPDGQAIVHANTSSEQGLRLGGVTIFAFDSTGKYQERIEARTAALKDGSWELRDARIYGDNVPPLDRAVHTIKTILTAAQVRETFATPEAVSFWDLPSYIATAENSGLQAAGYRLQYQKLLSRPFLLTAMVLLAAAVSLRFFRFGGVQPMILSGIAAGFLLYVLSKVTDDLSKAEMMSAFVAAWSPVAVGGLAGLVALLFQEDG